jgi:hypothetical protein
VGVAVDGNVVSPSPGRDFAPSEVATVLPRPTGAFGLRWLEDGFARQVGGRKSIAVGEIHEESRRRKEQSETGRQRRNTVVRQSVDVRAVVEETVDDVVLTANLKTVLKRRAKRPTDGGFGAFQSFIIFSMRRCVSAELSFRAILLADYELIDKHPGKHFALVNYP